MKTALRYLNPHAAHARLLKTPEQNRKERGFSMIETMAAMAIVAILALVIVPQFGKYMERAALQHVVADISSAQLLVDSDYGLSGSSKYTQVAVAKSVTDTKKNPRNSPHPAREHRHEHVQDHRHVHRGAELHDALRQRPQRAESHPQVALPGGAGFPGPQSPFVSPQVPK